MLGCLALALACFATSGVASAGAPGNDCSPIGAWIDADPDTHVLRGWLSTFTGQSSDGGTINLENPGFDLGLSDIFPTAVNGSGDWGVWKRTGGNTFKYRLMGTAVDSSGAIVWVRKISGMITILDDCKTLKITAVMAVYLGTDNPFEGTPLFEIDLGDLSGYRLTVP
jgi:hypothetical protein